MILYDTSSVSGPTHINNGADLNGYNASSLNNRGTGIFTITGTNVLFNLGNPQGNDKADIFLQDGSITVSSSLTLCQNSSINIYNGEIMAYFTYTEGSGHMANFVDQTYVQPGCTITGWSWDFGDGVGTSTVKNPSYTYAIPSTYTVVLTVTDSNSNTSDCTISVVIT